MITKHEAGILLAIIDRKIPYIPVPHSQELAMVARAVKGTLRIVDRLDEDVKSLRSKLERKIRASQQTYNRLLEENRRVESLERLHSFIAFAEGSKPKNTMRKYVVKLDNGDLAVDFLLENKTWRDYGARVVKWMDIPDDKDFADDADRRKRVKGK